MVTRSVKRTIRICQCERCGHAWTPKGESLPRACAKCKSLAWNTPRGSVKPGPKPKRPRR